MGDGLLDNLVDDLLHDGDMDLLGEMSNTDVTMRTGDSFLIGEDTDFVLHRIDRDDPTEFVHCFIRIFEVEPIRQVILENAME